MVTCTFVMHHVAADGREAALAEMWRVLRPGGRLLGMLTARKPD